MSPHHWSNVSKVTSFLGRSLYAKSKSTVSDSVSEWQGHLLSCSGQLKNSCNQTRSHQKHHNNIRKHHEKTKTTRNQIAIYKMMLNQVSSIFQIGWKEPGTSDEAVAAGHDVRIITWVDHTILSKPLHCYSPFTILSKPLLLLFRYHFRDVNEKHCQRHNRPRNWLHQMAPLVSASNLTTRWHHLH